MKEISEVIVVEGRDDEINLKRFFKCEVIRTNGFGISKETYKKIKLANSNRGVIVLTDPDHAGETIRKRISEVVKDVKHAFVNREDATKNDDIGIENASEEALVNALNKVRIMTNDFENIFDKSILYKHKLVGANQSASRREKLGEILGIGYCNGKQILKRLNNYGITKEEFDNAIKEIEKLYG
jgi:ribonuclease M5